MPLTEQENEVETTEWGEGSVSFIHTQEKGEWIEVSDPDSFVDLEEHR